MRELLNLANAAIVSAQREQCRCPCTARPVLHILGNIDDDRSGTAASRNLECGAHGGFEFFRIGHQKRVLRARAHQIENRRFLKCIRTQSARAEPGR